MRDSHKHKSWDWRGFHFCHCAFLSKMTGELNRFGGFAGLKWNKKVIDQSDWTLKFKTDQVPCQNKQSRKRTDLSAWSWLEANPAPRPFAHRRVGFHRTSLEKKREWSFVPAELNEKSKRGCETTETGFEWHDNFLWTTHRNQSLIISLNTFPLHW